jgi:hypothetical protein
MISKESVKNVYEALQYVMERVGYVHKADRVKGGGNYAYAGEAQFIAACRPYMVDVGLSIRCCESELIHHEVVQTERGPKIHMLWRHCYRYTHAASGSFFDVQAIGESFGNDDKGSYKAMTGALKYALRQTMLIETGNDPDETNNAVFGADDRKKQAEQEQEKRRLEGIDRVVELYESRVVPESAPALEEVHTMDYSNLRRLYAEARSWKVADVEPEQG